MVYVNTEVNEVIFALFKKSHANAAEIYTSEILKIHFKITEQHFQYVLQKVIHNKKNILLLLICLNNFRKNGAHNNIKRSGKPCWFYEYLR